MSSPKEERELVRYHAENGVAVLTLSDPPPNTYSYEMMQQLDRAVLQARMDDAVQVIVITGDGEKFFCAGADIQMLATVTPSFKYYFCLHANETLNRPMPWILCWNVPVSLESGSSFHGDVPPWISAMPWSSPEVSPRATRHEAVR